MVDELNSIGEKKATLKQALAEARDALLQWAQNLDDGDWTRPVYVHDEAWTSLDVLRHLTWAEGGMARLIQQIRQGHEGVPADFDLNRYNASGVEKLKEKKPAELISMMAENRQWVLQILDELTAEELQLTGRHGSLRVLSIEDVLRTIADHEWQHLNDLQQALNHR